MRLSELAGVSQGHVRYSRSWENGSRRTALSIGPGASHCLIILNFLSLSNLNFPSRRTALILQ